MSVGKRTSDAREQPAATLCLPQTVSCLTELVALNGFEQWCCYHGSYYRLTIINFTSIRMSPSGPCAQVSGIATGRIGVPIAPRNLMHAPKKANS